MHPYQRKEGRETNIQANRLLLILSGIIASKVIDGEYISESVAKFLKNKRKAGNAYQVRCKTW